MSQLVIRHYQHPAARRHLWAGLLIAVVGAGFGISQSIAWLAAHPMAAQGLQASLLAGLATGLGAIPVLFLRRPQAALMAPMLGLAGGMMLAASLFSLLVPAVQTVATSAAVLPLAVMTALALLAGAAAMQHLDRQMPHAHVEQVEAAGADHGMSLGIALQNIPEGWIVASAMLALGTSPVRAALMALATGLVEPVGGLFGVMASTLAGAALPLALAAAAGAMLWVVSHEVLPSAYRAGRENAASAGLVVGFSVMTGLAAVF